MISPRSSKVRAVTQTNPAVVTVEGHHDFHLRQPVTFSGVGGMTQLNGVNFQILAIDGNNISLADENGVAVNGTAFAAFTRGGTMFSAQDAKLGIKIRNSSGTEGGGPTSGIVLTAPNLTLAPLPSGVITAITQANPAVATVQGTNRFSVGQLAVIRDSSVSNYNLIVKITGKTTTTLTLADEDGTAIDTTAFPVFTGTATIEPLRAIE